MINDERSGGCGAGVSGGSGAAGRGGNGAVVSGDSGAAGPGGSGAVVSGGSGAAGRGPVGRMSHVLGVLAVACLCLVMVGACMTMPDTRIYSIYIQDDGRISGQAVRSDIALIVNVEAPRYLKQPYIASRTSPYELVLSPYAKWDAPPEKMLAAELKRRLDYAGCCREVRVASYTPEGFLTVAVNLERFEMYADTSGAMDKGGSADKGGADKDGSAYKGGAYKGGAFAIVKFTVDLNGADGKNLYHGLVDKKIRLVDDTFKTMAEGISQATQEGLDELVGAVMDVLKKRG